MKDISTIVIGLGLGLTGCATIEVPSEKVSMITETLDEMGEKYAVNPEDIEDPYRIIAGMIESVNKSKTLDYRSFEGILEDEIIMPKDRKYISGKKELQYRERLNSQNSKGPKFYKGAGLSRQRFF